jgi:hypothetical protein
MSAEKRRSKRRRVCYQAQILIDSATAPIEALVRDISETGAALRIPDGQSLPRSFVLSIEGPGIERHARVVWQSGTRVGVALGEPFFRNSRLSSQFG